MDISSITSVGANAFREIAWYAENRIRVRTIDVGGGFGVKLHVYPDEMATVLASGCWDVPSNTSLPGPRHFSQTLKRANLMFPLRSI